MLDKRPSQLLAFFVTVSIAIPGAMGSRFAPLKKISTPLKKISTPLSKMVAAVSKFFEEPTLIVGGRPLKVTTREKPVETKGQRHSTTATEDLRNALEPHLHFNSPEFHKRVYAAQEKLSTNPDAAALLAAIGRKAGWFNPLVSLKVLTEDLKFSSETFKVDAGLLEKLENLGLIVRHFDRAVELTQMGQTVFHNKYQ